MSRMTLTIQTAALIAACATAQTVSAVDPFEFFRPTVSLSAGERTTLDSGQPIVKLLTARDREVVTLSAVRVNVDGHRLVAWVQRIEELKRGAYVSEIGRFSLPPRIEDLSALTLENDDLEEIRRCRPGACGVKLSDHEIEHLRNVSADAGPNWKPVVQEAFRGLVLARVQKYSMDRLGGLPAYHDQKSAISPDAEFAAIIQQSRFLARQPDLAEYLTQYPRPALPGVESFLYWSKETLGGKPTITVTHVSILRSSDPGVPEALVAAKQIFATHYMTGSLALTTITCGADGSPRYLVYLNRSRVDVLSGLFGGLVRRIIERRLRTEAADVVQRLRRRLEAGAPPSISVASSLWTHTARRPS